MLKEKKFNQEYKKIYSDNGKLVKDLVNNVIHSEYLVKKEVPLENYAEVENQVSK